MFATRERWAVVGDDLIGRLLAMRLAQQGKEVNLYPAAPGNAKPIAEAAWVHFPHTPLPTDEALLQLLEELNLSNAVQWVEPRNGMLTGGRIHSISSMTDWLIDSPLNLWNRLRLAWTVHHAGQIRNPTRLERIRAADWLCRWSGYPMFESVWRPFLRARYGRYADSVSAAQVQLHLRRVMGETPAGSRRRAVGWLRLSGAAILEALENAVKRAGVAHQPDTQAMSIEAEQGVRYLVFADGRRSAFDRIVMTLPGPAAARLCPDLRPAETKRLRTIPYLGMIVGVVELRNPVLGFARVCLAEPDAPVCEMVYHANTDDASSEVVPGRLVLIKFLAGDDRTLQWSDEALTASWQRALESADAGGSMTDMRSMRIYRDPYALAVSPTPPPVPLEIMTSFSGVAYVHNAQLRNDTFHLNDVVRLVDQAAEDLRDMPLLADPRLVEAVQTDDED